jgi:hypothetical protein
VRHEKVDVRFPLAVATGVIRDQPDLQTPDQMEGIGKKYLDSRAYALERRSFALGGIAAGNRAGSQGTTEEHGQEAGL